jgi:nitrogen regulatory protein P-II 1
MHALFIVLNALDYLDDILAGFVREGISGATILDSQGMGSAIVSSDNRNIPLFGSLQMLLGDRHPYSKTIFTVLEDEEMVEKAVSVVQGVVEDISSNGVGFMFTVPIGKVYQMNKN